MKRADPLVVSKYWWMLFRRLRVHAVPAFFPVNDGKPVIIRGLRHAEVVPCVGDMFGGELFPFTGMFCHIHLKSTPNSLEGGREAPGGVFCGKSVQPHRSDLPGVRSPVGLFHPSGPGTLRRAGRAGLTKMNRTVSLLRVRLPCSVPVIRCSASFLSCPGCCPSQCSPAHTVFPT